MVLLGKVGELNQTVKEDPRVAFLYAPLQGNYNAEEFAGIQSGLIEVFNKKGTTEILSPSEMLITIESDKSDFNYAFFCKKYHVVKNQEQINLGSIKPVFPNPSSPKKTELITIGDFVLYDMAKQEIVYHKILQEKRSFLGENDYSWVSIVTPAEWKKEMEKKQTERKLDRNAKSILRRMEKDVAEYLGIDGK